VARSGAGRDRSESNGSGGPLERVVDIWRCSKTVKGGRIFSFSALAVIGDGMGTVGLGYGKAREVPMAVEKALKSARKSVQRYEIEHETIPHPVRGRFGGASVLLLPACPGTGLIAGGPVRAVAECAGVTNLLSKSFGSNNAKNLVRATLDALSQLRVRATVEELRGVKIR